MSCRLMPARTSRLQHHCIDDRCDRGMPLIPTSDTRYADCSVFELDRTTRHRHLAEVEAFSFSIRTRAQHDSLELRFANPGEIRLC